MTLQRQLAFWLIAFVAFILMFWLLSPVLLPFIAGLVLAYFLDPVADALERLGLPSIVATLIILLCSILSLVLIFRLVVPLLGDQIIKLDGALPTLSQALTTRCHDASPT
mgnify:CR=1 FL=1